MQVKNKQKGEAIVGILILSLILQLIPLFTSKEDTCRLGYLYEGVSGQQVISSTGGGIPCVVKEAK